MDWIALAGVIVPIVLAGLGVVAVLARTIQKVGDQGDDIAELKTALRQQGEDIDRAAAAALEVKSLASAIETLTEKFSDGLSHIGELFELNNKHVNTQFEDIKSQLKHDRANRQMGEQAVARARRS